MILEVAGLVRRVVPEFQRRAAAPEVICIRTTRPKFLVFADDASRPACVVQFGGRDELERLDTILRRLHRAQPDLVAEPLALVPWRDRHAHIQAGLPGTPWFRVADRYSDPHAWSGLLARAHAALDRLQQAIAACPEWLGRIRPGDELRRQARLAVEAGAALERPVAEWIAGGAERLDGLGERTAPWQHGDFCLNNLLIGPSSVAIIDFDEFGYTAMPLHDRIGLELSAQDLAPAGARGPRATGISQRLGEGASEEHWPGLCAHHLLWRINQCQGWPTRARARAELLARLRQAADGGLGLAAR